MVFPLLSLSARIFPPSSTHIPGHASFISEPPVLCSMPTQGSALSLPPPLVLQLIKIDVGDFTTQTDRRLPPPPSLLCCSPLSLSLSAAADGFLETSESEKRVEANSRPMLQFSGLLGVVNRARGRRMDGRKEGRKGRRSKRPLPTTTKRALAFGGEEGGRGGVRGWVLSKF